MELLSLSHTRSLVPISSAFFAFASGWATLTLSPYYAKRVLPFVLAVAFVALHRQNDLSPDPLINELFGRLLFIWMSYMPFLVYIKGYDAQRHTLFGKQHNHTVPPWRNAGGSFKQSPWKKVNGLRQHVCLCVRARGRCALKMLFNGRGINTEWQVHSLPAPRRSTRSAPDTDPKTNSNGLRKIRRRFVVGRAIALLTKYTVWRVWLGHAAHFVRMEEFDYTPEKQRFFRRLLADVPSRYLGITKPDNPYPVSLREIQIRLWVVFSNNLPSIVVLDAFHDALALIFVGAGFDLPDEWPPFFGSVCHACTVRGYWSKFWQLIMHRLLSSYATLILHNVLRIRQRSTFSHFIHGSLAFLMSGIYHSIIDHYTMPGCDKMPIVIFYALQPIALTLEAAAQQLWRRWRWWCLKDIPETKFEYAVTQLQDGVGAHDAV
ncbi:hypothetical protein PRK78_007549 [Emydomyces testavorans]|uniref:Wax synthase domain-containing protein n=1 Tax=Emydomyces testavorans TaxID=2070801 RepID=A0AAF0DNE4_9EURO|nr:hypothetical protein PRK78_007549 [Emydomyces testavorans]